MRLLQQKPWTASVLLLLLFGVAAGLTGCGGTSSSGGATSETTSTEQVAGTTLTILAASSLTDAFTELANPFEKQNPGTKVRTSFGGSSQLLTQIEQGAPADVFASADEDKMNAAAQNGLVYDPTPFIRNRPVVIVPRDNPAEIQDLQDLAKPRTRLPLAQDGVPIAEYTKKILTNANSQYGGDFEQQVLNNVVSRWAHVQDSANRVALGEADGTFVYVTDVTSDIRDHVQTIQIPKSLNVIATYPIATLKGSKNTELAQKWIDLVRSDEGQGVMEKYGFERAS